MRLIKLAGGWETVTGTTIGYPVVSTSISFTLMNGMFELDLSAIIYTFWGIKGK